MNVKYIFSIYFLSSILECTSNNSNTINIREKEDKHISLMINAFYTFIENENNEEDEE